MSEVAVQDTLLDPRTGELLDPADTPRVVELVRYLRDYKRDLQNLISAAQDAIVAEATRQGRKTLRYGKLEAKIIGGSELAWDVTELVKLLDAGLPEERYQELVTVTESYKVNANVAKQLEGANPAYREIIERARGRTEKPIYVTVSS